MALTRVGLKIETVLSEGCTKLTVEDITGTYNAISNPLGYDLQNGIAYNDITKITINVYYPSITTPIIYRFTYVAGAVTALVVYDLNGTAYDIFAEYSTLFVDGKFNLTGTTAFTLPTIVDGLFNVEYTISGIESVTSTEFNYTTNSYFLSTCAAECCITDMYKNLDMCCDCSEGAIDKIQKAEVFLAGSKYAIAVGQNDKAICLLDKAKDICEGNCENC